MPERAHAHVLAAHIHMPRQFAGMRTFGDTQGEAADACIVVRCCWRRAHGRCRDAWARSHAHLHVLGLGQDLQELVV
jgi:hypothetical protein